MKKFIFVRFLGTIHHSTKGDFNKHETAGSTAEKEKSQSLGFGGIRKGGTLHPTRFGTPGLASLLVEITVGGGFGSSKKREHMRCLKKGPLILV